MTGEPTVNIPLLRKVMDHITAHPEEHDQGIWAQRDGWDHCGTTMCIAGWAAVFAGHQINWSSGGGESVTVDGGARLISVAAQAALGLTDRQSQHLFLDSYDLPAAWDVVEHITGGELTRPDPS